MTMRTRAKALAIWLIRLAPPRLPRQIGVFEVGLYVAGGSLEWLRRHSLLLTELERIRSAEQADRLSVLDFGGASGALATTMSLYGRDRAYRVLLADIDTEALAGKDSAIILDPAGSIPLPDDSVDVAVSSDVFEHIPPAERGRWAAELGRVARLGQLHTFPADSADGTWRSTAADVEFDRWYQDTFGERERWTTEHLATNEPTVEEMGALFPGAQVRGFSNIDVWSAMLIDQHSSSTALRRLNFGLRYLLRYRRADRVPPWKAAILSVRSVDRKDHAASTATSKVTPAS
jgi:SAM-dependent methyltransferase